MPLHESSLLRSIKRNYRRVTTHSSFTSAWALELVCSRQLVVLCGWSNSHAPFGE